jgi:hypothetical protein
MIGHEDDAGRQARHRDRRANFLPWESKSPRLTDDGATFGQVLTAGGCTGVIASFPAFSVRAGNPARRVRDRLAP